MKLLYLHVRHSESLYKDACIHFDPKWRFEEKGEEIWCSRSDVEELPKGFFSIGGKSPIDGVTAIVGKNGCGKTSLACFLNDIRGGGRFRYEFTLIYETTLPWDKDDGKRYWFAYLYRMKDTGPRYQFVSLPSDIEGCQVVPFKDVRNYLRNGLKING